MRSNSEIRKTACLCIEAMDYSAGYGDITIGSWTGTVVWTRDGDWEHVSVAPYDHSITPSWDDMCKLKDIFFRDEEEAIQIHPKKSEYVNMMTNCLHLWRPNDGWEMLIPPARSV